MKPQTLQIKAPKGYEIDEDKSTYSEIVFKPIKPELAQSWEDLGLVSGYYINGDSVMRKTVPHCTHLHCRNVFTTKAQAESAIAMAQLSQLMAQANDGLEPEWAEVESKHCITREKNMLYTVECWNAYYFLAFKDRETRDTFLETHRELIETYLMIPK
ncbi:MAG: hypothetical protein GY774_04400 [Planctomycetes bacterium]|nr:hypothetical protein [Planctomycetota bacterium]